MLYCSNCRQPLDSSALPDEMPLRKRGSKVALILSALLLLAGGTVLALHFSGLLGSPANKRIVLPQEPIGPDNIDQVIQLGCLGKGYPAEVDFSPDGKLLAVATSIGVYLYNSKSLKEVAFIETNSVPVSVSFSPDGTHLASGSKDGTLQLWNVADGSLARTLEKQTGSVQSVSFSPDGAYLASGSWDGTVRFWGVAP